MKWHRATETPRPDTEVLAEVKGFKHNRFIVLKWTEEGWWQHIPRMNDIMPSDGWIGTQGLFVIRWAYIAEKDLAPAFEFPFDVTDNDGFIVFTPMDNQTIRRKLKLKKGERVIVSIRKEHEKE